MKNTKPILARLFVLVTIVLLFLASKFKSPDANETRHINTTSSPVPDSQFIIGAFHDGFDITYNYIKDSLKFNTWHHYTAPTNLGWWNDPSDRYDIDTDSYKTLVTGIINDNNINRHMRTFMDRPVLEYLIGGQRVDYQCEQIAANYQADPYWFYAYNYTPLGHWIEDIIDTTHYGNREMVRHCKLLPSEPVNGYLLIDSGLRSNREMSFNQVNEWMRDSTYEWYVMPRIRIDSAYAADVNHNIETICKIVVTGWKGEIEKEYDLTVKNFKQYAGSVYNGRYMESFYQTDGGPLEYLEIPKSKLKNFTDTVSIFDWNNPCYCDIKIYWSGKCDMWIDRVRIENLPAHQFMTLKEGWLISKVNSEIGWASQNYDASNPKPNYFYFEECQMSHFPMISELNKQIMNATGGKNTLVIWLAYHLFNDHVPYFWNHWFTSEMLKKYLYDDYGLRNIVIGSYALEGWERGDPGVGDFRLSYHPNTLSDSNYNKSTGVLSYVTDPSAYDTWLQNHFDGPAYLPAVNYTYISKIMYDLSKEPGMNIIYCPQAHLWYEATHKLKEPSNEELELQTDLALTYNAKGIIYFGYACGANPVGSPTYAVGILNPDATPRHHSVYNQDKFKKIAEISSKLNKWGPYLIKFDPVETKNCIYRLENERNSFLSGTYFNDLISYKHVTGSGTQFCDEDAPQGAIPTPYIYDCNIARYVQVAVFQKNPADVNKYFMIVNRRCSPDTVINSGDSSISGKRDIWVKFDVNSSDFANFNNWNIINLYNDSTIATFDKRNSAYINLDWFLPGEGRLFKIAPVMTTGGTLVCDEVIPAIALTCYDTVYNNGHNITINIGSIITFSQNGKIEMTGGGFYCGNTNSNSSSFHVTLTGLQTWNGLTLNNCDTVQIRNTYFNNITDSNYAVDIVDCGNVYIDNNKFSLGKATALRCQYIGNEGSRVETPVFSYNSIKQKEANVPAVLFSAYDSRTINLLISHNSLSDTGEVNYSQGIYISGIYGAVISGNTINNYSNGILLLASSSDIYDNTISTGSSNDESVGINAIMSDYVSTNVNSYYIGGRNTITNNGSHSVNLNFNNSVFNIDNGENTFNISSEEYAYHMYGWFPVDSQYSSNGTYVNKNCFRINGNPFDTATAFVSWGENGDEVEFIYGNSCESELLEDYEVIAFGDYIRDTVYKKSGGQGGSFNERLKMKNYEYAEKSENTKIKGNTEKDGNTNQNFILQSGLKVLLDSITVNSRKRNYSLVEVRCKEFLDIYSDSVQAVAVLPKLYLACKATDSLGSKMNPLKTYLENLILNNNNNITLTTRAFYYIQKCKVAIGQYQSAMQGFQQIMTQFPYSYEGLVASWDYSATHLLDSLNGHAGSVNEEFPPATGRKIKNYEYEGNKYFDSLYVRELSKSFKPEERNKIRLNLREAFNRQKVKDGQKIKDLEKKVENGSKTAKRELTQMKALNECVKPQKPKTTFELKTIIERDIKKIFTNKSGGEMNSKPALLPQSFELFQNYPNPFNSVTKISYALPQSAKVNIAIYDILGREITKLVNGELQQPGRYIVEFNGQSYASGVYFYRIIAEGKKEYIMTKKMVLIK